MKDWNLQTLVELCTGLSYEEWVRRVLETEAW